MLSLLKSGGALKPAGVIKPTEIAANPDLIGEALAVRLFPEFHASKNVIWYVSDQDLGLARIPEVTFAHYQNREKPILQNLRQNALEICAENCWYIHSAEQSLSEVLVQKKKDDSTMEIFVQYFNRDEAVPETCEKEKILDPDCMRPIAIREVRRKIKTPVPHYFMQRYQGSQFYLFVERQGF